MARTLTMALLATGSALASEPGELPACSRSLELKWMDPHNLLPRGQRWMEEEVETILSGLGLDASWDGVERPRRRHPACQLRVVLLPSEPGRAGWNLPKDTMGITMRTSDEAPPPVYIFYPAVLRALGSTLNEVRAFSPWQLRRTTRALGRVMAHEVFHALAPREPHAKHGLMQRNLSGHFLAAKDPVRVDERWRRVLVRAVEARTVSMPV